MLDTVISSTANNSLKGPKHLDVDFLHEIGSSMAAGAASLHEVLSRVVDFSVALVKCDSCFIYVLENNELVLRASKNPHDEVIDRLKLPMGQGITGHVAENSQPSPSPRMQCIIRISAYSANCRKIAMRHFFPCRC
jgi:uroporphyrinogen-III synthase